MKQPKIEARDSVVISWITKVQETKQLLVDEEKPEKPVVLPGAAMQREGQIGRIPQRCQDMPGRRD